MCVRDSVCVCVCVIDTTPLSSPPLPYPPLPSPPLPHHREANSGVVGLQNSAEQLQPLSLVASDNGTKRSSSQPVGDKHSCIIPRGGHGTHSTCMQLMHGSFAVASGCNVRGEGREGGREGGGERGGHSPGHCRQRHVKEAPIPSLRERGQEPRVSPAHVPAHSLTHPRAATTGQRVEVSKHSY